MQNDNRNTEKPKRILAAKLKVERLQTRAANDHQYVEKLAEQLKAGKKLPPITIVSDGDSRWLVDGTHRLDAAIAANKSILVDYISGDRCKAVELACGANQSHGLRRTNADKRQAVTMALQELQELGERSDRAIATICGVGNKFVGDVRAQVCSEHTSDGQKQEAATAKPPSTRTGKDGKRYPAKAASAPEPDVVDFGAKGKCVDDLSSLSGSNFGAIYADPPWQYSNQGTRASTDGHYETLSLDAICEMPVLDVVADDAHLHLWTTNAFLFDAKLVMEAWGFEYRSTFVWVKPQMGIGNYWRVSHEFLLLGIRGDAKRFNDKGLRSWGEFDRTKHSAKPEQVRKYIEAASPGPYLEMFGRSEISGWTVFGNQIERKLFA